MYNIFTYIYICFLAAPTRERTLPEAAAVAPTRCAAGDTDEDEPTTTPVTAHRRSPTICKFKFIRQCQSISEID